jgi:two-component system, sensor histidine kinase and response regulator
MIDASFENTDEEKIRLLKTAHKSTVRLYSLLESLLSWSRLQTDHTQFNPKPFDLSEIINKNKELASQSLRKKNIHLELAFTTPQFVIADEDMIDAVVRNLLSNAIKFTHPGGLVRIKAESTNCHLTIAVQDTGVGMGQSEIDHLFEIENYSSRPGTDDERGTGLGLIICKEFIIKNKGEIWVESKPNQGTTVFFTLPSYTKENEVQVIV